MQHIDYMTLALSLAERGRGTVSPNPMVGCVIVNNHQIVGQGYHQFAGKAHAEIMALEQAQEKAKNAVVYITLEPCCHQGRTPPCTNALIKANVRKVFVAHLDPNPLVNGRGVQLLQEAGIEVEIGLCEKEAKQQNEIFFHYIKTKIPFVIAKWAMSLDGKTIAHSPDQRQISGQLVAEKTHQLRSEVDAILIGSRTAMIDDPQLTARFQSGLLKDKQPIRIILVGQQEIPFNLKLLNEKQPGKTIIVCTKKHETYFKEKISDSIELLILEEISGCHVNLSVLLQELGARQISSLLVEGGMTIHQQFFKQKLVNKVHVSISPCFIGDFNEKIILQTMDTAILDQDLYCTTQLEAEIKNV